MKNLTDYQLVEAVKQDGNNDAFKEICQRYENVFYKICQKYVGALTTCGLNVQDIFDEKNFIIFHCIKTYDMSKKTKLSTWIGNYARYLCLNSINARKFILPSSDEEIRRHIEDNESLATYVHQGSHQDEYKYMVNLLSQIKDKRIAEVFKHRYNGDPKKMVWCKIAKKMNISTQTAINLHTKGIELLKRKINSDTISDTI